MPEEEKVHGESPWRINLTSYCQHDLGAVLFKLLARILGIASQKQALGGGSVIFQAFLLNTSSCKSQESCLKAC